MARFRDRQRALELRKEGKSYSQIKAILKVSKSTLSYWLRNYPLSKQRIRELRDWNEQRIERYRETMRRKREERLKAVYIKQKRIIFPLTQKEKYLSGLFLYWGEGSKTSPALTITNTNPAVIKFFINWLSECLDVFPKRLRVHLHLYQDMNIEKEIRYWTKLLQLKRSQFTKPYIKKSLKSSINHKGMFGHGTCKVTIGDARLSERVLMGIKAVSDYSVGQ